MPYQWLTGGEVKSPTLIIPNNFIYEKDNIASMSPYRAILSG